MREEGSGCRGEGRRATHVIRLRGPWTTEDGRRVKLPMIWRDALGDMDSVVLSRSFNCPTNLDEVSQVFVRIESPHAVAEVRLNDAPIELQDDRAEISDLLRGTNLLTVQLERCDAIHASLLDVQLEIATP